MPDPTSAPLWERVDRFLDEALELVGPARDAFLASIESEDPSLAAELRALLRAVEIEHGPLDSDVSALLGPDFVEGLAGAHQAHLASGRIVGAYRILRELGHGGMGRVFLAERADGAFQQRVALKILRWVDASEDLVRRFRNERQILAQLEHRDIARLLDGGVTAEGVPYLVMEFVEGRPIDRYCAEEGLGLTERIRLFRRVCEAVQFAHAHLIIHRDLKPANILVGEDGGVKLVDFGIAKLLEPGDGTLTGWGSGPLTPCYAAPEQIAGGAMSTASDVYALGTLLFELLAGARPFETDAPETTELSRRIVSEDPPLASTVATRGSPSVPWARRLRGDLDSILLKALRRAPDARYRSADRLAEDLARYEDGLPVEARTSTGVYVARRFLRRHRAAVAATLVVTLGLGAGVVAALTQARRATTESIRAREAADRSRRASTVLRGLLELADPYGASEGGQLTVRELLDQGVARAERELTRDTTVLAEVLEVVGRGYERIGDYDAARRSLRRSLELREAAHDTVGMVSTLGALGGFQRQWGSDDAVESYERGLRLLQRTGDTATLVEARLLAGLAQIHLDLNDLEEAERLNLRSTVISKRFLPRDDPELLRRRSADARLQRMRGNLDEAVSTYWGILDALRSSENPDLDLMASTLNNLAFALKAGGDDDGAVRAYQESLGLLTRIVGRGHPTAIRVAGNLAGLHHAAGRLDQAERLLVENVDAAEPYGVNDPRRVSDALRQLGGFYLLTQQHRKAAGVMQRVLDAAPSLPGVPSTEVTLDRLRFALALEFSGRQTEAARLRGEAFQAIEAGGPLNYFARNTLAWIADRYAAMGATELADRHRPAPSDDSPG